MFEVSRLLPFQFGSNLFKFPHSFLFVQAFSTFDTNLSLYFQDRRVNSPAQELFYLFLYQVSIANWASTKWHRHYLLLSRQSIHKLGLGRYTVIKTVHWLTSLYAQTL